MQECVATMYDANECLALAVRWVENDSIDSKFKKISVFVVSTVEAIVMIEWEARQLDRSDLGVMEDGNSNPAEELLKKGTAFCDKDYKNAMMLLQKVLQIQTEELGEDNIVIANTLEEIASIYNEEKNYDKSLQNLYRAFAIRSAKLGIHLRRARTYYEVLALSLWNKVKAKKPKKCSERLWILSTKFYRTMILKCWNYTIS